MQPHLHEPRTRLVLVLQKIFYFALFVFLFVSFIVFIFYLAGDEWSKDLWAWYNKVYLVTLVAYTWFTLFLLFHDENRRVKYPRYANEKISVIVPVFNEEPELLRRSIESVVRAKGNKEIIIVDDGSTNNKRHVLRKIAKEYGLVLHFFQHNQGKRHALHYAVKNLIGDTDFVVTIDSDTVLDEEAFTRVVEPLKVSAIAASTGNVYLLNEKQNWLTRMIGAYYWIGLNIYKRGQSSLGMVVCCSGCLAAYRTKELREIIDPFVNQEFFGEKCTHSEDRHLTNLILERGYKVVYVPEAISYTETPATVKGFLKQQQRWKRGYVRESVYTLSWAWRSRKLLFCQILFWDLTVPFLSFGLILALVISVLTNPVFFVTAVLPSWLIFMAVRYMPIFFQAPDKIPGLLVYMAFYNVFLYWQSVYALFTVKNKSWITR